MEDRDRPAGRAAVRALPASDSRVPDADLGKRLDALVARARKAEAGVRVSAMRQIRELQRRQALAKVALSKLGRQGAAASEPIIVGLQKAWRDIELAVRKGAKRFHDTT